MTVVRRTLLWHVLGTVAATSLVCVLVAAGVWWLAHAEAERRAEEVSRMVARAVVVPLADRDLAAAGPAARDRLLLDLEPFRETGMVSRVKIWLVEGSAARVVFSDEPRIEGVVRQFDPALAARLDGGGAVVLEVPDDDEHRYEQGGGLREVFLGFTDAAGRPARVEVYVPVDVEGATAHAVGLLVPPVVAGLVAVAAAVLPLSVALARRRERERAQRRDAALYGLAAGELARRDLARRLHDDVLPGLASAGLMLDLAPARPELVGRARETVGDGVVRIRSVLDDLLPDDVGSVGLPAALRRLAASGEPAAAVEVHGPDEAGGATGVLLHRIAGELLRNARAHAGAATIVVSLAVGDGRARLTVADDGAGFDPGRGPAPGHVGLFLVRTAARDAGGGVSVRSAPGAGAAVTVDVPTG